MNLQSAKAAVVINPASGGGLGGKRWPKIAAALKEEGLTFVHCFTEKTGDATEITRRFLQEGYELIVSVGGDGTNNEVVNGFFHQNRAVRESAAIGFISTGSGSDLIKTLGIPKDFNGAARHLIKSPVRPVDVGRVAYINNRGIPESRFFINVAGLGLDGDTVRRVTRTSKLMGGFLSFLWGTVVSLLLYKNKKMAISVDGKFICDEQVTVVVIGNGSYFGGGMFVAPNAKIDDGLFDIIIMRNLSKKELLINLPGVYRGTHLSNPKVTSLRGKTITVSSDQDALLELDGEQPGRASAEIIIVPLAINLKG